MYPLSFNEGKGIFVHQQVKELVKYGCKIKVISPLPLMPFPIKYIKGKWKRYSAVRKRTILEGIEVYHPRYLEFPKTLFFASSGRRMFTYIQEIVEEIYNNFKFDIIHAHVALPDGYFGMKIAQRYKKPLVVTIHGQDFYGTVFRKEKCKKNIQKVINFSNKTIVVSNTLKNLGEEGLNIKRDELVVVPNGIDLKEIRIYKNDSVYRHQYRNKRIILSIGYLIERKAHIYVIEAIDRLIRKHPNIIYLIGGDGPEGKKLKEITKKKNLENYVKFLGRINRVEVMSLMSACDIFALPSWDEAFGVVYLEAMIHGKPVIACEKEGSEDFLKNRKTGILVKPKDIDSLSDAIDYLLLNPEKAKEIGKAAKKLVLDNYNWEKSARKIIIFYREILGS